MSCYYHVEYFLEFMSSKFQIDINEKQVAQESILLYKEELEEGIISERLLDIIPEVVLVHTCIYNTLKNEWMFFVVSDYDKKNSFFLVCMKDGETLYEEILKLDR
ncbi:hypothetical protein U8Y98_21695 [Priestia megaterium]|uniref:hypothetical protein n=1 Tax=Priestia megaterium TaxID=1404 RepID=UPI002FE14FBD